MAARSLSTRRGFVLATSLGVTSLYGLWAGLGLAPWPWEGLGEPGDRHGPGPGAAGGGHGGHGAEPPGPSPEEFRRLAEDFARRHRLADGSVRPGPAEPGAALEPAAGAPADPHAGHAGPPDPHAGHAAGTDPHAGHAAAADPHAGHAGSPSAPTALPAHGAAAPVEVYLMAFQWGFEPAVLRLEAGRPYRFKMMAVDVAHGAALRLGPGSRVIRLRRGALVEQDLTFTRPGSHLLYCTVFCGPGHDRMAGRILVG